jgi:basic amino acid/polyamine antiporter, APA family
VIFAGATKIKSDNWTCVNDNYAPYGGAKVFSGAGTVFFSFLGFDMVSSMAEEVKKPQRDLPLGIIGSLLIAGVVPFAALVARSMRVNCWLDRSQARCTWRLRLLSPAWLVSRTLMARMPL